MTEATVLSPPGRFPLRFLLALLVMGFTALMSQVVLTRELLTVFFGSELSIALVLVVWLIGSPVRACPARDSEMRVSPSGQGMSGESKGGTT